MSPYFMSDTKNNKYSHTKLKCSRKFIFTPVNRSDVSFGCSCDDTLFNPLVSTSQAVGILLELEGWGA